MPHAALRIGRTHSVLSDAGPRDAGRPAVFLNDFHVLRLPARAMDPFVERIGEARQIGHDGAAVDALAGSLDAGDDAALCPTKGLRDTPPTPVKYSSDESKRYAEEDTKKVGDKKSLSTYYESIDSIDNLWMIIGSCDAINWKAACRKMCYVEFQTREDLPGVTEISNKGLAVPVGADQTPL